MVRIHSFLCVMFARLSELRSVLQGLLPELILSQKCNTVNVHIGPICNGCWFRNSWRVVAHFTRDGFNNTRNSHLWDRDNPHGTVESNYQHLFAINVWCGVIGDQLIGPYIYRNIWQVIFTPTFCKRVPAFLEHVPLQTRRQMGYQNDGAPPHFSQVVRQYLTHRFPNRSIGPGGAQNWPPRSADLNPSDYHVWGYMKAMVYAHKVNTREELLQQIHSAARSINNTAVLRKVTSSLVTRDRKFIQADGGHFEQLVWVLNGESVTVVFSSELRSTFTAIILRTLLSDLVNPEVVTLTPGKPVYDWILGYQ